MEEQTPDTLTYVTLGGDRYELVPTAKLTFPEIRLIKKMTGMSLVELETGLAGADPDAWFAWLFVSMRRQHPTIQESDLENLIGDSPLLAVIEAVKSEGGGADLPPGRLPRNGASAQTDSIPSSAPTPAPSIHETPGLPN
jgi:hypothetical protein